MSLINCPLCSFCCSTNREFLMHILDRHDPDRFYLRLFFDKQGKCKYCEAKVTNQEKLNHIIGCQVERALSYISKKPNFKGKDHKSKLSPFINSLLQGRNQKSKQKPQEQEQSKETTQVNTFEEEEDNTYIRFIASTIHADGLDVGEVEIGPISRVDEEDSKPAVSPNTTLIDKNFWDKLDKIDTAMKMNDFISIDDEGELFCKQCHMSFHTTARLLQHYWDNHQRLLDKF